MNPGQQQIRKWSYREGVANGHQWLAVKMREPSEAALVLAHSLDTLNYLDPFSQPRTLHSYSQ